MVNKERAFTVGEWNARREQRAEQLKSHSTTVSVGYCVFLVEKHTGDQGQEVGTSSSVPGEQDGLCTTTSTKAYRPTTRERHTTLSDSRAAKSSEIA